MLMVMSMKGNGEMIKLMGLVSSLILTMLAMKENGLKIYSTVRELRLGTMGMHATLVNFSRARSMAREDLNGMMAPTTKAISLMVSSKASENTTLQTWTRFIKANLG